MTTVEIDSSGLARGIQLAQAYSKRMPEKLVNTAGYYVAADARRRMPFVTPNVIDTQLSVIATPVIGKRGKPLKRKKVYSGGSTDGQDVPLAVLIVQARSNPQSVYNLSTNQRYALAASPFKGVSRAAGAAAMAALVHSMIASRHKSGKFLAAGWIPAIKVLSRFKNDKYSLPASGDTAVEAVADDKGSATPAIPDQYRATCIIENNIGYSGKNAENFNRALNIYGAPALQAAVDTEGVKQMNYYLKKSSDLELVGPVNAAWK